MDRRVTIPLLKSTIKGEPQAVTDELQKERTVLVKLAPTLGVPSRLDLSRAIQNVLKKTNLEDTSSVVYPLPLLSTSDIVDSSIHAFIVSFSTHEIASKFKHHMDTQNMSYSTSFYPNQVFSEVSAKVSDSVIKVLSSGKLHEKVWQAVTKWCKVERMPVIACKSTVLLTGDFFGVSMAQQHLQEAVAAELLDLEMASDEGAFAADELTGSSEKSIDSMNSTTSQKGATNNSRNLACIYEELGSESADSNKEQALEDEVVPKLLTKRIFKRESSNQDKKSTAKLAAECKKEQLEEEEIDGSCFIADQHHNSSLSNRESCSPPKRRRLSIREKTVYDIVPGKRLFVYVGDITKEKVDVIVNAANSQLKHLGGVASAIANAAGDALKRESYDHVRRRGELQVTKNAFTSAGRLPCKRVLHAVGPKWSDFASDKETQENRVIEVLGKTILNCMNAAIQHGFKSIAIPAISSGIFGCPVETVALALVQTVLTEWQCLSGNLCEIHIVDTSHDVIAAVGQCLAQMGYKYKIVSNRDAVDEKSPVLTNLISEKENIGQTGENKQPRVSVSSCTERVRQKSDLKTSSDDDDLLYSPDPHSSVANAEKRAVQTASPKEMQPRSSIVTRRLSDDDD